MEAPALPSPLKGLRVLDLTTVLAGPYCTYQLSLLGAEVTKLERPGDGDWARTGVPVREVPEFSAQFVAQNAGKKSITLDLQSPEGKALALKLIARADIVVENFSAGVADRLGVGYESARIHKPDIVYCAISGYGQDGPMARRPAYDHVVQAASGITLLNGTAQTVPNRIGPPLFDYLAGMYGAFAVMGALRERDRTGRSQMVDVAMLDAAIVAMASTVSTLNNAAIEPKANGNTAASGSPASGIFETKEGLLSMAANQDAQVARLCAALDLPGLLLHGEFNTPRKRLDHAEQFRACLVPALKQRTAAEWEQILSDAHLPVSRVRTLKEVLSEPHLQQRGVQQVVVDKTTGHEIGVPSLGYKWNGHSIGPLSGPPRLGEHTRETLLEIGIDAAEIQRLRDNGIV